MLEKPYIHMQKKNLGTDLSHTKKKTLTDINIKCKTIKLIADNVGESLADFEFDDDFFRYNRKA